MTHAILYDNTKCVGCGACMMACREQNHLPETDAPDLTDKQFTVLKTAAGKDGAVNYPYLSDGMWFLTQHKRWGLLKEHPDYLGVARAVNKIDIYKKAAAAAKVVVPKSDMRSSKLVDGIVWDGSNPKAYADGFKIKV